MILLALSLAAAAANVPELPKDVPASATLYHVRLLDQLAGQMASWSTPDGKLHAFFQFNDRGRGPKTTTVLTVDANGIPSSEITDGNDYLKADVHEEFLLSAGNARWKNRAEQGQKKITGPSFYV